MLQLDLLYGKSTMNIIFKIRPENQQSHCCFNVKALQHLFIAKLFHFMFIYQHYQGVLSRLVSRF